VEEIRPGLWTWTARHPEWTPGDGGPGGWEQEVRSYAVRSGDTVVLIDPLEPPNELKAQAAAVLLTVWSHVRSGDKLGLPVHAPASELARVPGALPYDAGDTLPGGVEVQPGFHPGEPLLWIPEHGALVSGDVLLGDRAGGIRLEPEPWMPSGTTAADAAAGLRHLLDLPIRLLLPTHGDPVTDDAPARLRLALA
jgi:hypothetical protein